jgi:hypothetical protein
MPEHSSPLQLLDEKEVIAFVRDRILFVRTINHEKNTQRNQRKNIRKKLRRQFWNRGRQNSFTVSQLRSEPLNGW